jgi:hypothetical protein
MKRVTIFQVMDFSDDTSDEECISCSMEVLSQNGGFPSDEQIKIEILPGEPE